MNGGKIRAKIKALRPPKTTLKPNKYIVFVCVKRKKLKQIFCNYTIYAFGKGGVNGKNLKRAELERAAKRLISKEKHGNMNIRLDQAGRIALFNHLNEFVLNGCRLIEGRSRFLCRQKRKRKDHEQRF